MTALLPMNELMPAAPMWDVMKRQGEELIKSGFLPPSIKMPEQFMLIVFKGRELGLPPMYACNHIVVIQGKPTMSAEVMLAMIYKNCPNVKIQYLEVSNDKCTIKASRPGNEPSTFSFTMDDAKAAGLTSKENWRKYPRAMLRSRCISELARSLFPDCIAGVSHTPEELGAITDESGEVVEIPVEASKPVPATQAEATGEPAKRSVGYDPANSSQAEWFWKQVTDLGIYPANVIDEEYAGLPASEILVQLKKIAGKDDSKKRVP